MTVVVFMCVMVAIFVCGDCMMVVVCGGCKCDDGCVYVWWVYVQMVVVFVCVM